MTAKERGRILFRLADLVEKHGEELALLETLVRVLPDVVSLKEAHPLSISALKASKARLTK